MFPPTDGISTTISPHMLVGGHKFDYNKHCCLEFGAYAQVHEQHNNSMVTQTTSAITLHPTGNKQGGYYFYSLTAGRRLNQNTKTAGPNFPCPPRSLITSTFWPIVVTLATDHPSLTVMVFVHTVSSMTATMKHTNRLTSPMMKTRMTLY
jgi:hypothetical protein